MMKSHLLAVFVLTLSPSCVDGESPPDAQPRGREYRDQAGVSHALRAGAGGAGGDSSGAGGKPECVGALDCPQPASPCVAASCASGACVEITLSAGADPGPSFQKDADCVRVVCDGAGSLTIAPDVSDAADDGDPCTTDSCLAGVSVHTPTKGAACAGGWCNASGACVECLNAGQCDSADWCVLGKCVPPSCMNFVADVGETDVDCGGADCAPCGSTKLCSVGADCQSLVCSGGVCQVPTCGDGLQNGDETGIDCGGFTCPSC